MNAFADNIYGVHWYPRNDNWARYQVVGYLAMHKELVNVNCSIWWINPFCRKHWLTKMSVYETWVLLPLGDIIPIHCIDAMACFCTYCAKNVNFIDITLFCINISLILFRHHFFYIIRIPLRIKTLVITFSFYLVAF